MAVVNVDIKELLEAGGHFGHQTSRWHPKMAPFIHSKRDGNHIIDLTKTVEALELALEFLAKTASEGKQILLVSTKRQAKDKVREVAQATKMPYVTERWLGGMLTNINTIGGRIKHLVDLENRMASGELENRYSKLEVQRFAEEIEAMNHLYGGIKEMPAKLGALFVVDMQNDIIAVREARKLGVPVVGLADTNVDPSIADYPIPCNDDATKTINLVLEGGGVKGIALVGAIEVLERNGYEFNRIAGTSAGADQRLGKSKIIANRNFANKLWNIARYIQDVKGPSFHAEVAPKSPADHWILNKLSIFSQAVDKALAGFKFAEAYKLLYHFVWDDFADWYIEASKVEPNMGMLNHVLESTLKMAHPFAPFITETIWQNLGKKSLLAAELWPEIAKADKAQARQFEELKKIITEARQIAINVGVSKPTLLYKDSDIIEENKELVKRLGRLGSVKETGQRSGIRLTGTKQTVWLDIDHRTARSYLEKLRSQMHDQEALIKMLEDRLANKAYVKRAPKKLVEETKAQLTDEKDKLQTLQNELKTFEKSLNQPSS